MKSQLYRLVSSSLSIDRRVIRLLLLIVSIILFVLGAGAPDAGGGIGIRGPLGLGG